MKIRKLPEGPACLNVGCGNFYFPEWTNIDLVHGKGVDYHDIRQPLPYPDASFDAVYSSHVLEHLTLVAGRAFLAEQWRVLKSGGICRVVVPDLEGICTQYLVCLRQAWAEPTPGNVQRYRWMMLELVDQMVREKSGGLMREALERQDFDEEFVRHRMGDQFARYYRSGTGAGLQAGGGKGRELHRQLKQKLKSLTAGSQDPRKTGEAHKWMYDRLSLKLLLGEIGFVDFAVRSFNQSDIPHWGKYNLDKSKTADQPRKPDSLYAECRKPGPS